MNARVKLSEDNSSISVDAIGCLDTVENDAVRGWVYSLSDEPLQLTLLVDGRECETELEWRRRPDVADRYGDAALMAGFCLKPVSSEIDLLKLCDDATAGFEVWCNGIKLNRVSENQLSAEGKGDEHERAVNIVGAYVDSVENFTVKGWVLVHGDEPYDVAVAVNGQKLKTPCVRVDRTDVAKVFGERARNCGFEISLPGYMWEMADDNEVCEISLLVADMEIISSKVMLDKSRLACWIDAVAQKTSGEDAEYLSLLALEHVKYSNIYSSLSEIACEFVKEVASNANLKGYLETDSAAGDEQDIPAESMSSIMLREAMLELNTQLKDVKGELYPSIKQVYKRYSLKGQAKEWYLNLAVQLTCATDEFDKLMELTDFHYLDALQSSKQPHQLALLLPVLVSNGEIERATEILHQIAKHIENSWLPTECIAYAVRGINRLEMEGAIGIHLAEHFRIAFISVLDGFKAGWFSRLYDENLIGAMVELLSHAEFYTDYHKRDIVNAAIRIYGLSPVFWHRLDKIESPAVKECLAYPRAEWLKLSHYMRQFPNISADESMAVTGALEYFSSKNNQEVVNFSRELLVNSLNSGSGTYEKHSPLIQRAISSEQAELMRLMSHPLVSGSDQFANSCERLEDSKYLLRSHGDYHKSAVYDIQLSVSKALDELSKLSASDDGVTDEQVESVLSNLERKATLLGTWQGMFLGADILITAYQLGLQLRYRQVSLLMNAMEMIRTAVHECGQGHTMAPPICAAIRRVASVQDDQNMICMAQEIIRIIRNKFGGRYDWLQELDTEVNHRQVSARWPQDTLVLIETSRGELKGRCEIIRKTWLNDLKSRGIPYLFVTGGGSDEVAEDVLALNVPEGSHWDVSRIMKTYDWVINNSDAQYVVKVNDKCLLGVDSFFDTLSYRKYHYYGKIVRCSHSKMDRRWYHKISDNDSDKRCIDKSASLSGFVTGEYVSTLSMFAIKELCEVAGSNRGKRLISRAYCPDKVVAELLVLRNITPSDEDFDLYCDLPVTHPVAPNEVHGNGFLPGKNSPCKVARVEPDSLCLAYKKTESQSIWPKKIWPTYQKPSLKANSNQLELLTDISVVESLLREKLVLVSVVRNEMVMLPQFLDHYRRLGVKCFIFVDNCSDDGTRNFLRSQPDTILYSADTEYKHSHYGVSWQQAVMGNHCLGKWVILADADEFLVYEGCEQLPLADFIDRVEKNGADGALLYMIDMYPYGDLDDARFDLNPVFEVAPYFDKEALVELRFGGGMYSNSRNYVNGLRHRLAPSRINAYVSQKYALFKYYPWVRLCEGVHYAANMQVSSEKAFFAHFKYHSGFKEKVRLEVKRKQHFNGAEEYQKYEAMMTEMSGGFGVEGVSERYHDSQSFVRLIGKLD